MPPGLILLLFWLVCAFLAWIIANEKDAGTLGFVLGLLFGPLGMLAAFALDRRPKCPICGGRQSPGQGYRRFRRCPHCSEESGEFAKS